MKPESVVGNIKPVNDLYSLDGTLSNPTAVNFSETAIVGWSVTTVKSIFFTQVNNQITLFYHITGTSNSAATNIKLPFTASATSLSYYENQIGLVIDNGATVGPGRSSVDCLTNASLLSLFINQAGAGFTAAGAKQVRGSITYLCI